MYQVTGTDTANSGCSTDCFNGEEEAQIARFDEQCNSYCCAAALRLVMAASDS